MFTTVQTNFAGLCRTKLLKSIEITTIKSYRFEGTYSFHREANE